MRHGAPTVIDLFSGAGGFSLGFHAAGGRIVAAVDVSEPAGETFRANMATLQPRDPPRVFSGDEGNLEDLDLERIAPRDRGPDILIGGPPCQGFSRLGRAKLASLADDDTDDPRNELYRRFIDAARYWRPLAIVMENVPGMLSLRGVNVADAIGADLAACGYRVGYAVLNAAWYGVPQYRERMFLVGLRDDLGLEPRAPVPTHVAPLPPGYLRPRERVTIPFAFVPHYELEVKLSAGRSPATTVGDALDDLPPVREHLAGSPDDRPVFRLSRTYSGEPRAQFARLMRGWPGLPAPGTMDDHSIRRTPRDYETFRRMKHEDRYPEAMQIAGERLAERLAELAALGAAPAPGSPAYEELRRSIVPPYPIGKFIDKWRKLNPGSPSWTIPAHLSKDAYSHIHHDSTQARAISVREAARLQSFPDGFQFTGNMGDCFTQIGNAVPPLLAWAIAASLHALLGFEATRPPL